MAERRYMILSDFGTFFVSGTVEQKLKKVRFAKSGRPDRRYRRAKSIERYERAVLNYCKNEWLNGRGVHAESGVYYRSPIDGMRVMMARWNLKGRAGA